MKKVILLLTVIGGVGVSAPIIKTGTFNVGYDRELEKPITKNIQVWLNKSGVSEMRIEGEDTLSATFEDGKISAYVSNPKKYFFYSLDLNPKTESLGYKNLIPTNESYNENTLVYSKRYCNEGATALLNAHSGNGTKKVFCVTLK